MIQTQTYEKIRLKEAVQLRQLKFFETDATPLFS